MSLMPFASSRPLTLGVELELQLLSCNDYNLVSSAPDILRRLAKSSHPGEIKPEMTRSMIEINTSVQYEYAAMVEELRALRNVVSEAGRFLDVAVAGGGTHPFQHWSEQKIFDAPRFHYLSELYGYLAKQFTIFGQHVHIGCPGPDEALHLMHMLSRYIPHFIALSASSPVRAGTRYRLCLRAPEFGVFLPLEWTGSVRATLGGVRTIFLENDGHRRGGIDEGFLLGYSSKTGIRHH